MKLEDLINLRSDKEWEIIRFRGIVCPRTGCQEDYLEVIEEYESCNLPIIDDKFSISSFFDAEACVDAEDGEECKHPNFGEVCSCYRDGICHPPVYEVEIIIRRRRVR